MIFSPHDSFWFLPLTHVLLAVAILIVVYATHATQAIAFEWKPGLMHVSCAKQVSIPLSLLHHKIKTQQVKWGMIAYIAYCWMRPFFLETLIVRRNIYSLYRYIVLLFFSVNEDLLFATCRRQTSYNNYYLVECFRWLVHCLITVDSDEMCILCIGSYITQKFLKNFIVYRSVTSSYCEHR